MTELATTYEEAGTLALSETQTTFTPTQRAALVHIGIEHANDGDLQVFFHVCSRSGLDPFARQIHMIGRQVSEKGPDGEWRKAVKQTIQTGIDGFRLIGRRAADRARHAVSVGAPEWAHEDGTWRQVWCKSWGYPVAARVTIMRSGEPFTAVALFDEYKQTKYGGDLTAMWEQRRAGQLAKCAEALAWRMAFPQDLSGIYTDDEMGQTDSPSSAPAPANERGGGLAAALEQDAQPDTPESPLLNTSGALAKRMFAALGAAGITDRADRLLYVTDTVGRKVTSSSQMTDADAEAVLVSLAKDAEVVDAEAVYVDKLDEAAP